MKKFVYPIVIIFTMSTLIWGFQIFSSKKNNLSSPEKIVYTDTKTIPDNYTPEMAKSKGDVVIVNTQIYNKQKLDKFLQSIKEKRLDKVQIVSYTNEGDALIEQLYYDGQMIKLITDNTRNKEALSNQKEVNTYDVAEIVKQIKDEGTVYVANLLNGESFDIAYFKK
ncbi:DUF4362 domain-containing protein [Clostridium cylindrosporum]|uniref:Uncharacterized protein n=1 Tax=Clostridium cylindrosporum DSM 605 TaxID=1121307 RepID=A0A0J8D8S4_CLOCY|nr:DUF4362 domain-containing protein [Clostridium cylindrosporum]KMT22455.1 hypothetical protein CLCY_12c00380 [Clostridium cylindrosporum DSM 605]